MKHNKDESKAEVKREVSEIEMLKKVKKNLEEEISRLQKICNNQEAQAHSAQIKNEQDLKLLETEKLIHLQAREHEIEKKRIQVESRIDFADKISESLSAREREVENREQKLVDLEEKILDLNRQRENFNDYKFRVENNLQEAKIVIAEADEAFSKIDMERNMLIGREARIREQEKYWNDEIGKLEEEKRKFQSEKENFLGLMQLKHEEVVNEI